MFAHLLDAGGVLPHSKHRDAWFPGLYDQCLPVLDFGDSELLRLHGCFSVAISRQPHRCLRSRN